MALLGTLQVRLGLDSGTFTKGLTNFSRDAKSKTAGISKGFANLIPTKAILGGLASITAGLSAISFAKMIQASNSVTDSLAKQSDRLGIATEALQAYRNAASLAGVSQSSLEKGIAKLNRSIGEIKTGIASATSPVITAFEALGLSVTEIQRQTPEQVFETLVEELGKVPDAATKSALAMTLFGRSGQEMITLFNEGNPAIRQSRELLKGLGLEITRIDARKAELANDAFERLGQVAGAAKQRLAIELSPAIEDVFNRLLAAGQEGENFGQKIAGVADAIRNLVNAAVAIGNTFSAAFNLLTAGFAFIGAAVLGFASDFVTAIGTTAPNAFNSLLEATESGLTKMKQGFADFATAAANVVVAGMNKAIEAVDTLVNGAAAGITKFLELANKVPGVNLGTFSYSQTSAKASGFDRFPVDRVDLGRVGTFGGGLADGLGSYSEGFGITANSNLQDAGTDIRQAALAAEAIFNPAESSNLAAGLQEATTYANELTGALGGSGAGGGGQAGGGGVAGALDGIIPKAKVLGEDLKFTGIEVGNVWTDTMQSIGSAIDEFVQTGKLNFKDLGNSILQSIASAAIKNAINGIANAFAGATGEGGNSASSSGWVGAILNAVGSFEGGGYTGSGPRSGGMDGRGGRLAMVHPNETVIDHEKVRGSARQRRRGDGVNLTVPITLMPGVSKQELAEILPLVKRDIIQTIPNLISRGGRYAAAYGQ